MKRSALLPVVLAVACNALPEDTGLSGSTGDAEPSSSSSSGSTDPIEPSSEGSSDGGGPDVTGGVAGAGLPCEVDAFLAEHCRSCHAGAPAISATLLLDRDDLLADSTTEPGASVGVVAVDRLHSTDKPMPPPPVDPVPQSEADVFAAWVADGMPEGDCVPEPPGPDPFDVDPVCTSNMYWTRGLFEGDSHMDPGRPCIACHTDPGAFGNGGEEEEESGPLFAIAGTIYPTAHEPDDCYGFDGDVRIEVTAMDGPTVVLTPNPSGSFFLGGGEDGGGVVPAGFAPPYLVKVIANGEERPMAMPAPHGDCNLCHTQDGTDDALGRIIPPW